MQSHPAETLGDVLGIKSHVPNPAVSELAAAGFDTPQKILALARARGAKVGHPGAAVVDPGRRIRNATLACSLLAVQHPFDPELIRAGAYVLSLTTVAQADEIAAEALRYRFFWVVGHIARRARRVQKTRPLWRHLETAVNIPSLYLEEAQWSRLPNVVHDLGMARPRGRG